MSAYLRVELVCDKCKAAYAVTATVADGGTLKVSLPTGWVQKGERYYCPEDVANAAA